MKCEGTRTLFRYWDHLREKRIVPYRSEIDPRCIASLLEHIFILEQTGHGAIHFRLAGTRVCENFGMELRGMSALSLWQGESRNRVEALLKRVLEAPCSGYVSCLANTPSGFTTEAEFLFLPMKSDSGQINRILGCCMHALETGRSFMNYQVEWSSYMDLHDRAHSRVHPAEERVLQTGTHDSQGSHPHGLYAIQGGASLAQPSLARRNHLRLVK